jgi:catechol 2,3-dioxygenase-like lactoylglutathione lyase family enzyme
VIRESPQPVVTVPWRQLRLLAGNRGWGGATGPITSVYVRDPDGNLVEVSTYDADTSQAEEP